MSERDDKQVPETQQPVGGPVLYILAAAFAAIAGFTSITLGDFFSRQPAPEPATTTQNTGGNLGAASTQDGKGGLTKLVFADAPAPLPADIGFTDDAGAPRSLADYKGKVVLLNLWATWCAPCKVEMPSLSRLQAALGGNDFAVVPVSLDRTGPDAPRKFLASNNLGNLPLLVDASASLANKIGAGGLPATLIIDREGREIARLLGPAEWDGPAAKDVVRAVIAGKRKP
jgi:thiol-disulfide isomerase/thioredoxin